MTAAEHDRIVAAGKAWAAKAKPLDEAEQRKLRILLARDRAA